MSDDTDPVDPAGTEAAGTAGDDAFRTGGVETVPAALDGERVDRAIALLTGLTRAGVTALIDAGAVVIDGRTVSVRGRRVHSGQTLAVSMPAPAEPDALVEADMSVAFRVVYDDADIVVVDKPAGLVVHPGAGNRTGTLVQGLLARYPDLAAMGEAGLEDRPGIVHRLDKGTSGLLVVARTAAARRSLTAQLADHSLRRVYVALVAGTVDSDEGVIDAPLGRSGRDPTRITVDAAGRTARTHYRIEARYTEPVPATRLECRLETGRTHQIRVHLAAIGHPVIGDDRYSRDPASSRPRLPKSGHRPFLHARELAFVHPRAGDVMTFQSALPADLAEVLTGLR